MKKRFRKALVVIGVIAILVTYFAVQTVEIFYPEINYKEVDILTEEMRAYGLDTMRTESGLIIKKGPGSNYRISDPKTKILNGLNSVLVLLLIYVPTGTVIIVLQTRKEKKRGVQWASPFLFCFKNIYFSNKSECEPVLNAVNTNSFELIEYIKSQLGCIWHSLYPFIIIW